MDERRRLALHLLPKEAVFSPTSPLTPTAKMFRKKTTNSREKSEESKGRK